MATCSQSRKSCHLVKFKRAYVIYQPKMFITFFIFFALLVCAPANSIQNVLKSSNNARIVNGTNALLGERPFQVLLTAYNRFCGGSIISEYYILTAAHCVFQQKPHSVTITVGAIDVTKPATKHKASKLIVHKDFASTMPENDIALVKVEYPFEFSNTVSPISLMRTNDIIPNTSAWVSGWGGIGGPYSKPSKVLKIAEIYVVDQQYCADVMREINMPVYPSNICAYNPLLRRGHCSGDSGGPLTINGELAGIVSWSRKDPYCASTKYPNIYTRVSSFIGWIERHAV